MPRALNPELLDCISRPNPYSEYRIEISEPDVSRVLRRQDEFLSTPPLVGAMVPANSLSASARGSLILTPSTVALATYAGVGGSFDLNAADTPDVRYKGLSWTIDSAFSRATLKSIVAKVQAGDFLLDQTFECQIYRITKTPGVKVKNEYSFAPLLSPAPTVKVTTAQWVSNVTQPLTFDLSNFALILENTPTRAVTPDQAGELPKYLIVVRLSGGSLLKGTGHYRWLLDTVASHTVAGVGQFDRVFWSRASADAQWVEAVSADVPNITINIEAYPASGQAIYLVDLGAVPRAASTGRVEFQRALPPGTGVSLGLSVSGSGGEFSPVRHGDPLSPDRTNSAPWGHDLTNAAWAKSGAGTIAQNAVGIDGLPNTATTLTDTSAANYYEADQSKAIPNDGATHTLAVWIRKDNDQTRFPQVKFIFSGGTVVNKSVSLNTATGQIRNTAGARMVDGATVGWPGWWILEIVATNNTSGNTAALLQIYAAAAAVFDVDSVTGVGSVIIGLVDLRLNTSVYDFLPVFTGAAAVTIGDQQTYHLRTTLTPDAALHATPEVIAQGIEFRIPQDVSIESVPTFPTREISLPWPKASIPEGKIRTVRFGSRDYLDVGSVLGSTAATSRLEADIFLASRHPSITRDKWFRLERMMVSNRLPSATSEEFTLLSYAARLKRKIPQKAETLNSVHVVASSTTSQVVLTSVLPGTTVGGNEYDGKNYYMRVRSTTATTVPVGFLATIQGSTDTTKLDFTPLLPQALVAGDVIEVHSGIFATSPVSWTNYDPADAWWEVLTNLLAIPTERIGIGSLPRGGRPPHVTDIAPGDATTQAKRKITGRIAEETEGDKILDILSAIMGGVTLEIDGQICFVQIIPLTDLAGNVTVPLPPPAAVFDIRDFSAAPQTPPGIEARATIVSSKYGVPMTAASPDAFPSKATTAVDTDALLWLQQQDLTEYGTADVPDEIAAWLYNTTDEGLYLASVIGAQLVRVASTGLRVWPLSMTEKHPTLVPGDVVVITTDQYTDYDPSTQTQIKGPAAIRGVLVRVGNEGRALSMFVPGLRDNVQLIAGGAVGALTGLGPQPAAPVLSASFDSTGQLIINSTGDFSTASQKIAWATGAAPSAATVRAATPIAQQNVSGLATASVYPAGTTVFIAAFAYSGTALESTPLAVISASRQGSGTSAPPFAFVYPTNGETDDLTQLLTFAAVAGSGGGGTNLTYAVYQKIGFAAETTIYSGNATTLPRAVSITRHPRSDRNLRFRVTDTATGLFDEATWTIPSARPEINDTGNPYRIRPYDDGDYAGRATDTGGLIAHLSAKDRRLRLLDTGFQYGVDGAGGVVESASQKFTHGDQLDANRRVANVVRGATTAEPTTNLFKRGIDTASDVIESAAQKFVHGTMLDASRFITNVYRSAVTEPVGNLFKRGVDTAADIVETTARWFTDSAMLDASRRITSVYRAAATEPVGNLFKRGVDTTADVVTTSARNFVDADQINASNRIVTVWRGAANDPVTNLFKRGVDSLADVLDTTTRYASPVPNATSDVVLVASAGITLGGNNATKTGGTSWNEQVYSKDSYTGGAFAQAMPGVAGQGLMFGLNTDPTTNASSDSIDYAFQAHQTAAVLYIWESGALIGSFGTWAVGDVLAVTYDGSNIRWLQNGIVLRTVAVAAGITFFFDSSFDTIGAKLNNIRFGPMSSNNAGSVGAGTLIPGIAQQNGTGPKNITSGRYTLGTAVNAQSITYPTNYQNPPAVNILGGISYEPASVWGTVAQADANTGLGGLAPNNARQIDEVVAYNVTASTASLRARLRQASATTARTDAYATGAITTNGGTKEATTANAPASNDTYTSGFTAQFTSTSVPGKSCSVSGTVNLDYWNGSTWINVASATYAADDPVNGAADTGVITDSLVATVSGLTATSKFRVRLVTNTGAGSRTYSVDPTNVTYSTTTGDQFASKTPTIGGVDLGIKLSVEVIGAS